MNIYLIEPTEDGKRHVSYDCYDGYVVIASNEENARKLCYIGDEGDIWTKQEYSKCTKIGETTITMATTRVVLASFRAG